MRTTKIRVEKPDGPLYQAVLITGTFCNYLQQILLKSDIASLTKLSIKAHPLQKDVVQGVVSAKRLSANCTLRKFSVCLHRASGPTGPARPTPYGCDFKGLKCSRDGASLQGPGTAGLRKQPRPGASNRAVHYAPPAEIQLWMAGHGSAQRDRGSSGISWPPEAVAGWASPVRQVHTPFTLCHENKHSTQVRMSFDKDGSLWKSRPRVLYSHL